MFGLTVPADVDTDELQKARDAFLTGGAITRDTTGWVVCTTEEMALEPSAGDAAFLVQAVRRHPLAALGFAYGLRPTVFGESPDNAEWLTDLVQELGREDDVYHAVALIIIEYGAHLAIGENVENPAIQEVMANLSYVAIRAKLVPADLDLVYFIAEMVRSVIEATPVHLGKEERWRRSDPILAWGRAMSGISLDKVLIGNERGVSLG
ncbi:hypothetical protein [Pseudoclavibacter sp. CFCC 11306]|uniref:hypothetical protein n=1 Tax=Pseudoclavibacter sp. CFCC 11306 TaxID=1564493 RepID=UPI0013012744|nr:hypothetical protein [Pseudoclavibacter sp. CFCC 11306]KAB1658160.1 hypothetical protein F8O09_00555 [Pseudoclavibacter sp. CFCC 11306]